MTEERLDQAMDELAPRVARATDQQSYIDGLADGVEWADAHPYSTPEALVAAYEEGQRDAVEKGLARSWIARTQLHHVAWMLQNLPEDKIAAMLPGLLGIEVRDE